MWTSDTEDPLENEMLHLKELILIFKCLNKIKIDTQKVMHCCLLTCFFFQMDHFCSFDGHSGAVCGVVHKEGLPEFLTVSEDCSVRRWTWTAGTPLRCSCEHVLGALCSWAVREDWLECVCAQRERPTSTAKSQRCVSLKPRICCSLVMNLVCWSYGSTTQQLSASRWSKCMKKFQPKYFSILLPSNFWLFPSPLLNFIVPELHLCLSYYMMVLIICLRVSGIK